MESTNKASTKQKYLRYSEACKVYGVGRTTMNKWVKYSGAARKLDRLVLINTEKLDEYIESCESPFSETSLY